MVYLSNLVSFEVSNSTVPKVLSMSHGDSTDPLDWDNKGFTILVLARRADQAREVFD